MQEKVWGVNMCKRDWEFYENQKKIPPTDFCLKSVDRIWNMSKKREKERMNRSRNENADFSSATITDEDTEENELGNDADYQPVVKKSKYSYQPVIEDPQDDMPRDYKHIRNGLRSVRPDIYGVLSKLQSELHMSHRQAEGAIITVGNELFGRKWKVHSPDVPTDCDTLPAMSNIRRTEPYMEAMALSIIVEEIMRSDGKMNYIYIYISSHI
jgi:hypothetical protein